MAVKKIALMRQEFGLCDGHTCGECSNLIRQSVGNRAVFKCKVYGNTASTASDWAKWYLACGLFNKSWNGKPLIRLVGRGSKEPQAQPDESSGQMSLF